MIAPGRRGEHVEEAALLEDAADPAPGDRPDQLPGQGSIKGSGVDLGFERQPETVVEVEGCFGDR